MPVEAKAAPAANHAGTTATGGQPGNLSVDGLTAMLAASAATRAKETETAVNTTEEVEAGAPGEQGAEATKDGQEKPTEAAVAPETEEKAAETEVAPETPETEVEPEAEPEPGTEEPEAKPAGQTEMPTELKEAIEGLKAGGEKGKADLLKRVYKLVDQRDTERNARLSAEEQAQQLRAELQQARENPQATGNPPAPQNPELREVEQKLAAVDQWLSWCDDNPEGGVVPDGKGGGKEFDAKQVQRIRTNAQGLRAELAAERRVVTRLAQAQYAAEYQKAHAQAVTEYPWLGQKSSPEFMEFQAILNAEPAMKGSPEYELMIGDYLRGKAARLAAKTASTNGGAARKPTATGTTQASLKVKAKVEPTRMGAQPGGGATMRGNKDEEEAEAVFEKSGRVEDLAKLFKTRSLKR